MSFRDGPKDQTRNLEIPDRRCATSGMTSKSLLRRSLERPEIRERHLRQRVRERGEIGDHLRKARAAFPAPLIHIDRAVEFELHGVQAAGRVTVMLGDEAAGIGLVAAGRLAEPAHGFLDDIGQQARATGAIAVADHDIGPPRLVA